MCLALQQDFLALQQDFLQQDFGVPANLQQHDHARTPRTGGGLPMMGRPRSSRSHWSLAVLLAVVQVARAQPDPPAAPQAPARAQVLTLEAAVRSALQGSLAARNEQLDRLDEQARWVAARAEFEPKPALSSQARRHWVRGLPGTTDAAGVSAGATWKLLPGTQLEARWVKDINRSQTDGTTRPLNRVLEIVQPLLRGAGAAARLGLERARLDVAMGQHLRNLVLDDVMASVTLAYFDAVAAHQQVGLARRALERVLEAQAVNRSLLQAGRVAAVELLQSEADVAQAELELAQARHDALGSASALLQLLGPDLSGQRPENLALPEDLPPEPAAPSAPDPAQALAEAQARRADLLLATAAIDAARMEVAQAVDDGRSTLNLGLRVQSSSGTASAGTEGTTPVPGTDRSIGLSWELPLDRGVLRLQHAQAQVNLQRAELLLEDAHRLVRADVDNALRELASARHQLDLTTATVELNRRKLDAETERLRAGKTSGFQLSGAQEELRAAESAQAQAAVAVRRAMLQLERSIGTLATRRQALMQADVP
jgi:outer membrane protein TolC